MLFIRGLVNGRAILFLAAPLLISGTLLWQHLSLVAPTEGSIAKPSVTQGEPPSGVSAQEWETARAEFEGITDSTFQCGLEEMPAYWRLLRWSARQPENEQDPNRFPRIAFHELVNSPNVLRGAPVQVDLHICRIAEHPAPENGLGIERLYEVWGWSDDSRGSLYVAVTPNLPAGMAVGESVSQRATLLGHFFKIQGYLAAGTASQTAPSAAPLIIGRMIAATAPTAMLANTNELWMGGASLLLVVSFVCLIIQKPLLSFRSRSSGERLSPNASAKLEAWLDSESLTRTPSDSPRPARSECIAAEPDRPQFCVAGQP